MSVALVSGCGGGGGSSPAPPPTPGPVTASPTSLTFLAVGSGAAQTVTVSQPGFAGPFTLTNVNCAGAVSILQTSGTTFAVTPVLPVMCMLSVAGTNAQSTTLRVSVTQTVGGGS